MTTENNCKYVSSRGIMKSCDIYSSEPVSSIKQLIGYDFSKLKDGMTVYVCSSAILNFVAMLDKIKCKIILVSGDSDETTPIDLFKSNKEFVKFIENDKIIHWYAQNCVGYHPKLTQIPIGLDYHTIASRDHIWGTKTTPINQEYLLENIIKKAEPSYNRIVKCYSNFHFSMNPKYCKFVQDRDDAIKYIPQELVYYEPNKVKRLVSWLTQSKYAFVISPHGNGLDCHRTWEALCLGCIPIVRTSTLFSEANQRTLDSMYEDLPILIVKEWSDINETLLQNTLEKFKNKKLYYDKLLLSYWMNIIKPRDYSKGIVIACPSKYEMICLNNMKAIRNLDCNIPIEIWEIGNEISLPIKDMMSQINNVYFRNVTEITKDIDHWKGFQIKAFILYHTKFNEIILCDADMTFYKNPEIIYKDANYIKTGTYFFKDLDRWKFSNISIDSKEKFSNLKFYKERQQFVKNLIPIPPDNFPKEWLYLYDDKIPNNVKEALQESGVVYMNRKLHEESIKNIYDLNYDHIETYKYVWGDKETFWLGCLMAKTDIYFNERSGYILNNKLHHDYNGLIFWKQK